MLPVTQQPATVACRRYPCISGCARLAYWYDTSSSCSWAYSVFSLLILDRPSMTSVPHSYAFVPAGYIDNPSLLNTDQLMPHPHHGETLFRTHGSYVSGDCVPRCGFFAPTFARWFVFRATRLRRKEQPTCCRFLPYKAQPLRTTRHSFLIGGCRAFAALLRRSLQAPTGNATATANADKHSHKPSSPITTTNEAAYRSHVAGRRGTSRGRCPLGELRRWALIR